MEVGVPLDSLRIGHLDGDLHDRAALAAAFSQILARPVGTRPVSAG